MDVYRFKELGFQLPQGSGVIKASKADELNVAHDILTTAKAKATEIIEDAKTFLENEKQRGFAEGQSAANAAALERLLCEQATLDASLSEIEQSLAGLVLASVRKIIHDFSDVALAEALIHNGLNTIRREKRAQVYVPETLTDEMKTRIDSFMAASPHIEFMDVIEDPALTPPNIVIETPIGRIDCNLNNKLDDLAASITNAATNHSAAHKPSEGTADA
ncbi:MAG: type III secretion system stator protein SctL [Pseudomonadota bacterium]